LYTAVEQWGGKPRIVFVGSGLIYGTPRSSDGPTVETALLCPASPYATSKAAADLLSYQVAHASGLHIVRARPFNHTGPRQSTDYAIPRFAKQISDIERGRQRPTLETGNLAALRDLSDVRDVVHAYVLLMMHGQAGEAYNVASGQTRTMKSALDQLLSCARVRIDIASKPDATRAAESAVLCGDPSKLKRETGWIPRYTWEQTLADTLAYWRNQP
jgi:GDP-4-dehydro-6-deoxy-D-mannose reductase